MNTFNPNDLTPITRTQNEVPADLIYKPKTNLWQITELAWARLRMESRGISVFNHPTGIIITAGPEEEATILKRKYRTTAGSDEREPMGKGREFVHREMKKLLEERGIEGNLFNLEQIQETGETTYYRVVAATQTEETEEPRSITADEGSVNQAEEVSEPADSASDLPEGDLEPVGAEEGTDFDFSL